MKGIVEIRDLEIAINKLEFVDLLIHRPFNERPFEGFIKEHQALLDEIQDFNHNTLPFSLMMVSNVLEGIRKHFCRAPLFGKASGVVARTVRAYEGLEKKQEIPHQMNLMIIKVVWKIFVIIFMEPQ